MKNMNRRRTKMIYEMKWKQKSKMKIKMRKDEEFLLPLSILLFTKHFQ